MTQLPSAQGIASAAAALATHVDATPLVGAPLLCEALAADVWLKVETVSPIASFKHRGALTALLRARDRGELRGAVTSSTGNHGQGVAYAAGALGVDAHVFLPADPNPAKRRMIAALGADVHLAGRDLDEAKEVARRFAAEHRLLFVDDGESLDLMEGAGTVGAEIARGLDHVDRVYVPMGSGTLATGCGTALKSEHPDVTVTAVQAVGAPAMAESFRAGRAVERPAETIADGLECRVPAERALEGIRAVVDEVVTVTDERMLAAVHTLAVDGHVLAEPAGAAALAAAWEQRPEVAGRRIVLLVSGANLTAGVARRALAGPALDG